MPKPHQFLTLRDFTTKVTSCAECQRTKVKCDREIPCNNCKRKNCVEICPNGVKQLKTGIQFFRNSTQPFQRRIDALSNRIFQLEEALAGLHSMESSEPHPLLRDVANEEEGSDIDYHDNTENTERDKLNDVVDAMGTLSVSDNGCSRFLGTTGGCESLLYHSNRIGVSRTTSNTTTIHTVDDVHRAQLFSSSFPFFVPRDWTSNVRGFIESFLPPYEQATALCKMFFDNLSWVFGIVTSSQLMDEMLPIIYHQWGHVPTPILCKTLAVEEAYSGPHDVALLFVVMAMGSALFPDAELAEHFHQLANAALLLQPVLEWPSLVTIQTLISMVYYLGMAEGNSEDYRKNTEKVCSLTSIAVHLAQSIGLHRDSANWGLSPNTVDRRKCVFWNIVGHDLWESLHAGRPPRFSLTYIDSCLSPAKGGHQLQCAIWKMTTEIIPEILTCLNGTENLTYATVIELDKKVRSNTLFNDLCAFEHISSYVSKSLREALVIYIHHIFFSRAMLEHPKNPLESPYASSFLASFRASSAIIKFHGEFFKKNPLLGAKVWFMWRPAFSAAIIVGLVAAKLPSSSWAQSGLSSLEEACKMFEEAVKFNVQTTVAALPILVKLREKARAALSALVPDYSSFKNNSAFQNTDEPDTLNELLLFLSSHSRLLHSDSIKLHHANPQYSAERKERQTV